MERILCVFQSETRYGKNVLFGLVVLSFLVCFSSCKEDNLRTFIEQDDSPPKPVSNVKTEALPGAAMITYDLPEDDDLDLLYVKAIYEIRPGVRQEQSTSFYDHEILVQGFGDTDEHEVKLISVDRSGNESQPVTVVVKPLTPPVKLVYESLDYESDFSGIRLSLSNSAEADIMVGILVKDEDGDWKPYDKDYTSLPEKIFSVRGLESVPTTFGVYVRDRWLNFSDTMVKRLTPLFEEQADKNSFQELALPGDASNSWDLSGLWDEKYGTHEGIRANDNNGLPAHYQFSIGERYKISRFRLWGIIDGREYSSNNIKAFEIWGSDSPTDDFSGWTLMGTFEVKKPSGLPPGQYTNEDRATAAAGDEFTMPFDAPSVKYIRINVLSTFSSPPNSPSGGIWLTEVTFWGQKD